MMNKFKSMAIEGYVKNKYPQYFQDGAFSVELNAEAGACRVSATLAGEDAPIAVDVKKYRVVSEGSEKFLEVAEIESDRPWLSAMLRDHLAGRRIPVPSIVAAMLEG
mgnify:FL=1